MASGGKWWWFKCTSCDHRCIRYRNVKLCSRCGSRVIERQRVASQEEQDAAYNEVIRKFNETPE